MNRDRQLCLRLPSDVHSLRPKRSSGPHAGSVFEVSKVPYLLSELQALTRQLTHAYVAPRSR